MLGVTGLASQPWKLDLTYTELRAASMARQRKVGTEHGLLY